jgi:hypothetical protein
MSKVRINFTDGKKAIEKQETTSAIMLGWKIQNIVNDTLGEFANDKDELLNVKVKIYVDDAYAGGFLYNIRSIKEDE